MVNGMTEPISFLLVNETEVILSKMGKYENMYEGIRMNCPPNLYRYPVVSYSVSLQDIPDHIALVINMGNCINGCEGCHSKELCYDACNLTERVPLEEVLAEAYKVYKQGARVCCIMGGTINCGVTKESLTVLINVLSLIFKVGLYSGSDGDINDAGINSYYAYYTPLSFLKVGSYKKELGGLSSDKTNQKFYERDWLTGEWKDRTALFRYM